MKLWMIGLLLAFGMGWTVRAEETSESNQRLKDALKRYPKADADGNGVLTMNEAMAFKNNNAEALSPKAEDATGNAKQHIYKTVGNVSLSLFVYTPKGHTADAKIPAVVFFHGGGFKSGSPKQFERQAAYFAARGMVAVSASYRLISDRSLTIADCVEDAKSAMRWVRANAAKLGVDPDRLAAGGGSAGGYLAVATQLMDAVNAKTDPPGVSAQPNAMMLFNPGLGRPSKGVVSSDILDPDGKSELLQYVKPNQSPMIQFFGTEDPFLPIARSFQEAYTKAGNRCEIITYEGAGHSFFNQDKYLALTLAEADKFLVGLGWLVKKPEQK